MRVLGISAYFHDAAAALVVDGRVVAAAQEERFSRRKHDPSLPVEATRFCLGQAGLRMSDIDWVVFYEKPLRKFERIMVDQLREFPRGAGKFVRAMGTWLGKSLWVKRDLCKALGCRPEQVLFCEHHLSHAASAFLTQPTSHCSEAAILTVDGVGEWATTSIFRGDDRGIELLEELHYPHSLGLLYSTLTAYLGFEVNSGEYKVMGLAAYGTPKYLAALEQIAQVAADASLTLDSRYFAFRHATENSFTPALERLLGPARATDSPLDPGSGDAEAARFADIAASLQAFTESYLLTLARRAAALTGCKSLCLAGGVALNSVANHRLAAEGPFTNVFFHPAAGDAGGAVGAALYVSNVILGEPRHAFDVFAGASYDNDYIGRFLQDCRVPCHRFDGASQLIDAVADRLAAGQVGAWACGRAEWGPRALGGRSILADPRPLDMADRVNRKIKFREAFRPFAPAVLAEDAGEWFDVGGDADRHLTPFMGSVLPVRLKARAQIPAVVHVDGTARVQTVHRATTPRLHSLLEAFKARTGIGVLLNTSLNLKDEPICNSPAEAYGTFLRSDLDFLVLEDFLVEKRQQPQSEVSHAPGLE